MQEIQDLKLRGYSKSEIVSYYEAQGKKPPSRPTINKYYNMDSIPENPNQNLIEDKVFDHEPFRSAITEILQKNNRNNLCISSVYDVLLEKFVEEGALESLPGNEQTLRNYIHYLENNGIIDNAPENKRIYDHVFDTPPGEQMLIDLVRRKQVMGSHYPFHLPSVALQSFPLCVFAQDHKFNAEEACQSLYRACCKLGGRPAVLVFCNN